MKNLKRNIPAQAVIGGIVLMGIAALMLIGGVASMALRRNRATGRRSPQGQNDQSAQG